MSLSEFKAWLEGFEHSFAPKDFDGKVRTHEGVMVRGAPTDEQWLLIKEKLALVGNPVVATQAGQAGTWQRPVSMAVGGGGAGGYVTTNGAGSELKDSEYVRLR